MIPDVRRGSGITTAQMKEAPIGSAFVWCNPLTDYARKLSIALGRKDLKIFGSHEIPRIGRQGFPAIIVDHANNLTPREWAMIDEFRTRCTPSQGE